ncbi:geranylgeranyl diphosphate synthase type I [Actinopolyspora biskrensis]|uniref:Geranylgeranyl diphosphate synthase type I n=1 Tax=Actinopolyspora biskrensis TaxID=1470178 RepID=A0A852Z005_9ACTN|nr:geranylgeranyl diphosphate synthase type I [Actinopolyspora biskrensis]
MTLVDSRDNAGPSRDTLEHSRALTHPALRASVERLPDEARAVAAYHLGWCDEQGAPHEVRGGKALRPALVLSAAQSVGGSAEAAVPAAVAVELVHNFSLLHDDVIDGDETRRHRPSAWAVFGTGAAILAGDAMLTAATEVLVTSESPVAVEAARDLSRTVHTLIHGQSTDMEFEQRRYVAVDECVDMAEAKTGALLGCACALGASFGGGTEQQVSRLGRFGRCIGLAFQHVDDLLGIWGDPSVTGKPIHSDLRSRKKTLPILAALHSDTPAAEELNELYRNDRALSEQEVQHAANLVERAGGRRFSLDEADRLLGVALNELDGGLEGAAVSELTELARLATRRDH